MLTRVNRHELSAGAQEQLIAEIKETHEDCEVTIRWMTGTKHLHGHLCILLDGEVYAEIKKCSNCGYLYDLCSEGNWVYDLNTCIKCDEVLFDN